jgi:hypothetical protein
MPFDATHLVFGHSAAQRTDPRFLRAELLVGAVAADSVGMRRALPMARSHLMAGKAARHFRLVAHSADSAAASYALGYLSHVWLDRFLSRWFPRHPGEANGKRMSLRDFYALIAQRDADRALNAWRSLPPRPETFDPRVCLFVDPLMLSSYCAGLEHRLLSTPPLDDDTEALAIFASERLQVAALEEFARTLHF